jgi:CheY-like chemotaxis protein
MKKRILVVDDEPGLTRMIKLNLEQTGLYEVRTENLARRAVEAAREFRPDLILLDIIMPGMLGSEVAAQLEQDPDLRDVKFVFLTAVMTKEEQRRLAGSGGHAYIAKPVGAEELCGLVEQYLSR